VLNQKNELEEGVCPDIARFRDFTKIIPIRKFVSYKGQRHLPGYYWFSQTEQLIGYESRLEMLILMDLDFKARVIDVISQPLLISYNSDAGSLKHVPDFLYHPLYIPTFVQVSMYRLDSRCIMPCNYIYQRPKGRIFFRCWGVLK
jgi:hypothetical protein